MYEVFNTTGGEKSQTCLAERVRIQWSWEVLAKALSIKTMAEKAEEKKHNITWQNANSNEKEIISWWCSMVAYLTKTKTRLGKIGLSSCIYLRCHEYIHTITLRRKTTNNEHPHLLQLFFLLWQFSQLNNGKGSYFTQLNSSASLPCESFKSFSVEETSRKRIFEEKKQIDKLNKSLCNALRACRSAICYAFVWRWSSWAFSRRF